MHHLNNPNFVANILLSHTLKMTFMLTCGYMTKELVVEVVSEELPIEVVLEEVSKILELSSEMLSNEVSLMDYEITPFTPWKPLQWLYHLPMSTCSFGVY